MRHVLLAAALLLPAAAAPAATDMQSAASAFLETEIRGWMDEPVLIDAIAAQNAKTAGLSENEILAMDAAWRSEVGAAARPSIDAVLTNDAAAFLSGVVEAAGGKITEIFVMDARGLNVAASAVTSDYWQGDEEKHSETFGKGPGAVHVGEIEFDESSQRYQTQISATIVDPATGEAIGAVTVGVDAEAMM